MESLYKLANMWKKNSCFFWAFVLLILGEAAYIITLQGNKEVAWYECINFVFVVIAALPTLLMLSYIIFMRVHMPKAKKDTLGIAFYIVNANEKQYESINSKFVSQFEKMLTTTTSEYSIVVIDDYHSRKYYPILNREKADDDGRRQARILKRRRCCVAILIYCLSGGDGEELFCSMETKLGVSHQPMHPVIRAELIKDISIAFAPLRKVNVMKLTETPDLSRYSLSMEIVFKYILASTYFHCQKFDETIKMLQMIEQSLSTHKELPEAVIPIKNVLEKRFAICYKVKAECAYRQFCEDHKAEHLKIVQASINNVYCKKIYGGENKILEGICSFVLDSNVTHALQCMNTVTKADSVLKFNKAFLSLYEKCTTKTVKKTVSAYKHFKTLPPHTQEEIEAFTFSEYEKNDDTKKQLLLILFFIYDFQENSILAKRCLEQFCTAFPKIVSSGEVCSIFRGLQERYSDVEYVDGEVYSI